MSTLAAPVSWTDHKRYLWPLGIAVMLLPLVGAQLASLTGLSIFWWFAPLFIYTVLPLADWLVGEDRDNPPDAAVGDLQDDSYYRIAVFLAVPVQLGVFAWGVWTAATANLGAFELLGLAVSIGGISGVGINTAHEIGHQPGTLNGWLAKLALAPSLYGHFYVEHNRGHHVRVATPEDPASARFGEHFYEFLPRSVIGSLRSAIRIESARLAREGRGFWSPHNHLLQGWSLTVLLFGALTAWAGWWMLGFLLFQGIYGFSLLEVVNYLEHYGLCRARKEGGGYERCQPEHSWNSNHVVTNVFLYHLQRHSDHHANPTRHYQALRHFEHAPQLPSGYAGMVLLAYVPFLWFRIMNPKVVAHYRGDMRRANIKPSIRERVIAEHAATA